MKLYTSSWFTYTGPGRVGISRGTPRGAVAGYRIYRALAPTWAILKECETKGQYEPRFRREILEPLDPHRVLDDLFRLAAGAVPVMLCYERPPFSEANFCHRHMVADWLTERTGATVEEWSGPRESNPELPLGTAG